MVHKAFREALGETATQAGSENAPGRFRFDFSATGAVPGSVMADVEARVNEVILDDLLVHAEVMSQAEAVKSGAMALFGEKYGDQVRVVSVGDWARELCGGTHAGSSGKLGVIKLLGESSIGSGVRRVEALVGTDAYQFLAREHVLVAQLSEALKARPEELPERVNDIVEKLRAAEKELEKVRVGRAAGAAPASWRPGPSRSAASPWSRTARARRVAAATCARSRSTSAAGCPQGQPGVVVVIGDADGKVSVVAAVNDEARARGLSANELVRAVGPLVGGKGGGKDDVAQGGGTDASRIDEALALVRTEVRRSATGLRHGVRLGLDPGDARIGVARSDPTGLPGDPGRDREARPRRPRPDRGDPRRDRRGLRAVLEVVVGLPRSLSGRRGPGGGEGARSGPPSSPEPWPPVPVRLADERLTTVSAEAMLRDRGRSGAKRRAVVDQAAAVRDPAARARHRARQRHRPGRDRREDHHDRH